MTLRLVHEDDDFAALIDQAAADQESQLRAAAMVEKDYWITHILWLMSRTGVAFTFKGGTALSKAYHLTNRFSEDIDLVVTPPSAWSALPQVDNWHSSGKQASVQRRTFWLAFVEQLKPALAPLDANLDVDADPTFRNIKIPVAYPGGHIEALTAMGAGMRPFVQLEMTYNNPDRNATSPATDRPIDSEIHRLLERRGVAAKFVDNRPSTVRCVHPMLTLWEKLDATARRYDRPSREFDPTAFVRHYEDVARIILRASEYPLPGGSGPEGLRDALREGGMIRKVVDEDDASLVLAEKDKRDQVEEAYEALRPMYWSSQMPLSEALKTIREWLRSVPRPQAAQTHDT